MLCRPALTHRPLEAQELEETFHLWKAEHTGGAEGAGG